MNFELEFDSSKRSLSEDEQKILDDELPRLKFELKQRFEPVECAEHGKPETLTTLIDLETFPDIRFEFANTCCDEYRKLLLEAASA